MTGREAVGVRRLDQLRDPDVDEQPLAGGLAVQRDWGGQGGLPFNVTYRNAGADRDADPNRPDLIGDPRVMTSTLETPPS